MNRLTYKELISGYYPNEDVLDTDCFDKLGQLEDLMEKYEIKDLVELEIALDQYYHRYDNIQTRRKENDK